MVKGPFSHSALAAKSFRIGFKPQCESEWWDDRMTSNAETVSMIIERLYIDWQALPVGLRKTSDEGTIQAMQKICRAFQLCMEDLESKIPRPMFEIEGPKLLKAFELGTMDESLRSMAECQPVMDVSTIPDFKQVLQKLHLEVTMAAVEKQAELKRTVDSATFLSLRADLTHDVDLVTRYIKDLKEARANWSAAVAAHKRQRRRTGLDKTLAFMKTRLDVGLLSKDESLSDLPKHYAVFKTTSLKEFPSFTTDDTFEAQCLFFRQLFWQCAHILAITHL